MRFHKKDPDKAYVSNNLLLPRSLVNGHSVKTACTFVLGNRETDVDPTGVIVGKEPDNLELWDETTHHLIVPREFIPEAERSKYGFDFVDLSPQNFRPTGVQHGIKFRDQRQEEAFNAIMANHSGTLNLRCGGGKTVITLAAIAELQVPAIVVVNATALLDQWLEEIDTHLTCPGGVGVIQGQNCDWEGRDIVLATIQTLSTLVDQLPQDFFKYFGISVYDEGHHMSAPMFVRGAHVSAGRRLCLTATAERTDNLQAIYQYHLGPVFFRDLEQDLIPRTIFHNLSWKMPDQDKALIKDKRGEVSTPKIRGYLGELDWRNEIIVELLEEDLRNGRTVLVTSHSVPHVNELARLYSVGKRYPPVIITGKVKENRIPLLRHGNPIFATFQLVKEALDKPELDTLYVTTTFGNANDVQQGWGRTQRPFPQKQEPLIRVFVDMCIGPTIGQAKNIKKFLRVERYPIEEEDIDVQTVD
jgi:superfamily II DNA or RNA helicase